MIFFKKMLYYL